MLSNFVAWHDPIALARSLRHGAPDGPPAELRASVWFGIVAGKRRSGNPPSVRQPCHALAVLIEDERGRAEQPILEALLEASSGDRPAAVRQAAASLLRSNAPRCLEVNGLLSQLLDAAGDDRSRRLFIERSLSRRDRPAIATVAGGLQLSRRRARELLDRSEARVRAALVTAPAPLPWTVSALRRRLGAITSAERADATLASLGVSPGRGSDLALWLAGPYREIRGCPGWLGDEGTDMVARSLACLSADGGVRPLVDIVEELGADVSVERLVEWLAVCGAAVVSDVAVSVSGLLADVAERVLDAHGTPLTLDEITACIATGGRVVPEGALQALQRNRRFRRVAGGRLALADWGEGETTASLSGPAAPDSQRVPAGAAGERPGHGGPADEQLGDRLAAGRGFPLEPSASVQDSDRLMLWVRVDAEVLRGDEAFVPLSLVEGLGLAPGCRRTFSSRYGPITLGHDGPTANRRSVRAIALAAGACLHDTLVLSISARGDFDVEVHRHGRESDAHPPHSNAVTIYPHSATSGAT